MAKDQYAMQDPTKQYPGPKFPAQWQSEPGLAKDMSPKPDHGEETYRCSGRLTGRKAVVTGGRAGQVSRTCTHIPIFVLLASQESSYVTAEAYGVTGGHHLP